MTSLGNFPAVDFESLSYPSDRLTIGDIRRTEPQLFAHDDPNVLDKAWQDSEIAVMLWAERGLAHKAFAKAAGRPDPHSGLGTDRSDLMQALADTYRRYGLASGPKLTVQMARDVEKQAAAQARAQLGLDR